MVTFLSGLNFYFRFNVCKNLEQTKISKSNEKKNQELNVKVLKIPTIYL